MSGPRRARTVIVDYGSGNLASAAKAFERAAREADLDMEIVVTAEPDALRRADRIVLPGVGAFADCRRGLDAVPGLVGAMTDAVVHEGRPFLGICVGMQLMATRGLEHEAAYGLDWIPGDVVAIAPSDPALKIPHMGWNTHQRAARHPSAARRAYRPGEQRSARLFRALLSPWKRGSRQRCPGDVTDYGEPRLPPWWRGTIIAGTQFHPEKSQRLGLALISQFPAVGSRDPISRDRLEGRASACACVHGDMERGDRLQR